MEALPTTLQQDDHQHQWQSRTLSPEVLTAGDNITCVNDSGGHAGYILCEGLCLPEPSSVQWLQVVDDLLGACAASMSQMKSVHRSDDPYCLIRLYTPLELMERCMTLVSAINGNAGSIRARYVARDEPRRHGRSADFIFRCDY